MIILNYWPILVASLVGFAVGALWYSPILFGREWLALIRMSETDIAGVRSRGVWKHYLTQFIMSFISFCVLAFAISLFGLGSSSDGAFGGLLAWLGFILPMSVSNLLWKKEPIMLVLIETVNYLLILMIGGAIIGAWR